MRLRSVIVPLMLALAAAPGPAPYAGADPVRQSSGVSGEAEVQRLAEFLGWAHPAESGCGLPIDIRIVEKWSGGLMARYDIPCGGTTRSLQGAFQTRERDGGFLGAWAPGAVTRLGVSAQAF